MTPSRPANASFSSTTKSKDLTLSVLVVIDLIHEQLSGTVTVRPRLLVTSMESEPPSASISYRVFPMINCGASPSCRMMIFSVMPSDSLWNRMTPERSAYVSFSSIVKLKFFAVMPFVPTTLIHEQVSGTSTLMPKLLCTSIDRSPPSTPNSYTPSPIMICGSAAAWRTVTVSIMPCASLAKTIIPSRPANASFSSTTKSKDKTLNVLVVIDLIHEQLSGTVTVRPRLLLTSTERLPPSASISYRRLPIINCGASPS